VYLLIGYEAKVRNPLVGKNPTVNFFFTPITIGQLTSGGGVPGIHRIRHQSTL
jgi:hypothetical protein